MKFSKYSEKSVAEIRQHDEYLTTSYEDGSVYKLNPLDSLKLLMASSILGEPKFYEDQIIERFVDAVDFALSYDFEETIKLAAKLRNEYYMRLNPALICVRSLMPKLNAERISFNHSNPGVLKSCIEQCILNPNDIKNQFDLYMFFNKTKNNLPNMLKKIWSKKLSQLDAYHIEKYKNTAKIIDLVRITHSNSELINELMKTGKVALKNTELTFEKLRSNGKTWYEILNTTYVPHMALLKNLRGIFTEIADKQVTENVLDQLKNGVVNGMQFPFRYFNAYKAIDSSDAPNKGMILDALEDCIDIALANMPKIKGITLCLSDNSGSTIERINNEYSDTLVRDIDNLSSLITCLKSDYADLVYFSSKQQKMHISKRNGILKQLLEFDKKWGGADECMGTYLSPSLEDVVKLKTHYDNIFIYTDCQIMDDNILELINKYRRTVNKNVNVFCVQTAGYSCSLLPEVEYRYANLTGWTGKESIYANEVIDIWNKVDEKS